MRHIPFIPTACAVLLAGAPVAAATADALVKDAQGGDLGNVSVRDTASGQAHVVLSLTGLPAGVHGIHIHETGDCSAADFKSAGGHLAGDAAHGVLSEDGPHPGDLPNATVQSDGAVQLEYFVSGLRVADMTDEDGAAFIVHAGADDYESQPSGAAGSRIACGVFRAE